MCERGSFDGTKSDKNRERAKDTTIFFDTLLLFWWMSLEMNKSRIETASRSLSRRWRRWRRALMWRSMWWWSQNWSSLFRSRNRSLVQNINKNLMFHYHRVRSFFYKQNFFDNFKTLKFREMAGRRMLEKRFVIKTDSCSVWNVGLIW